MAEDGPFDYEVHHPDKKKVKQVYNVNLLKERKKAPVQVPVVSLLVSEVESEGEDTDTLADLGEPATPALNHLSVTQSSQLIQVFQQVPRLFAATPGWTVMVKHTIWLKDKVPVRQRSYRVLGTPGRKAPGGGEEDSAPGGE